MPPRFDAADYIRRKKLAAIKDGNAAANQNKFRALTRFDTYQPHNPSIKLLVTAKWPLYLFL